MDSQSLFASRAETQKFELHITSFANNLRAKTLGAVASKFWHDVSDSLSSFKKNLITPYSSGFYN